MLVFHEWPNAPWYPVVRDIELRSFLVTSPCYLSPRMYLRPKPRWNTMIAIVDGAAATPRVQRMLGTQTSQACPPPPQPRSYLPPLPLLMPATTPTCNVPFIPLLRSLSHASMVSVTRMGALNPTSSASMLTMVVMVPWSAVNLTCMGQKRVGGG